jgi:hypothetical protein
LAGAYEALTDHTINRSYYSGVTVASNCTGASDKVPITGRMARVAEAWDRSTAPGATSRSTISSASVPLQRLRLACRSGARLIPVLATRHGRARPGSACLWTDILNPL